MKSAFTIGTRGVGQGHACFVIAAAGAAHEKDVQMGYRLIETAGGAGAQAALFSVPPAAERTALSDRDFKGLLGQAQHVGMTALATVTDLPGVDLLATLDVAAVKIASAERASHALIGHAAAIGRPLILAAGRASLAEVEEALAICVRAGNEEVAVVGDTVEPLLARFPAQPVGLAAGSCDMATAFSAVKAGAKVMERPFRDVAEIQTLVAGIREVEASC